ncbi:HAD family hydrolase, partial [Bacteroides stercoris]
TWQYETHDGDIAHPNFIRLKNITDIMEYLL